LPVKTQQKKVRMIVKKMLGGWEGLDNPNKQPITMENPLAPNTAKGSKK
jgi:hypothetical protein